MTVLLSCLFIKVCEISLDCRDEAFAVSNAVPRLSIANLFPKIFVTKLRSHRKTLKLDGFGDQIFYGELICIFRSHSLPNMWRVLVMFRSVSSVGS